MNHGVFEDFAVINERGLVGKVVHKNQDGIQYLFRRQKIG